MLPVCCRPISNTGQGRRRLNARAALRAAGQDKQPHMGPVATFPQPHSQPTQVSSLAARQPSLDTIESGSSRKCKAMAGAYSSTYRKMQAQGQLLQPSMQLTLTQGAAMDRQELLPSGKLAKLAVYISLPVGEHLPGHCVTIERNAVMQHTVLTTSLRLCRRPCALACHKVAGTSCCAGCLAVRSSLLC